MTKKHFIALADTLKASLLSIQVDATLPEYQGSGKRQWQGRLDQWRLTRNMLGDFCLAQNPRFNRELWLNYIAGKCGPNGGAR